MSTQPAVELKIAKLHYAGEENFVGESPSGHALVTSFAHDAVAAATPMELLLIALGGCTGADVVTILEKKRQKVTAYDIEVRGQRRAEHPRIYTSIEIIHRVRGIDVDPGAVARAVELSEEKYCSVSAMLSGTVQLTSRSEVINES